MFYNLRMRASDGQKHISGAEGIYKENDILTQANSLLERALSHSRGIPDQIHIAIERLDSEPLKIKSLPVSTYRIDNESDSQEAVMALLRHIGIIEPVIKKALSIVSNKDYFSGAALLNIESAKRLDTDDDRGIRVSRLGITSKALQDLSKSLSKYGINSIRVREALVLASKVAASTDIEAELCVSDNPDYTIGYIASRKLGYVRIPFIKEAGLPYGGRVFFVREGADTDSLIDFLKNTPVIINEISECRGVMDIQEIFAL